MALPLNPLEVKLGLYFVYNRRINLPPSNMHNVERLSMLKVVATFEILLFSPASIFLTAATEIDNVWSIHSIVRLSQAMAQSAHKAIIGTGSTKHVKVQFIRTGIELVEYF